MTKSRLYKYISYPLRMKDLIISLLETLKDINQLSYKTFVISALNLKAEHIRWHLGPDFWPTR